MGISIALHALAAAVIWVGGMFFAYTAMRPAVIRVIEPSRRPELWCHTLSLFFRYVWGCIGVLLVTGYGLIHALGGMGSVNWHIHVMHGLGLLMMLIFLHLFFAPYRRLEAGGPQWRHGGRHPTCGPDTPVRRDQPVDRPGRRHHCSRRPLLVKRQAAYTEGFAMKASSAQ